MRGVVIVPGDAVTSVINKYLLTALRHYTMPAIDVCTAPDGRVALRRDDAFHENGSRLLGGCIEQINGHARDLNYLIVRKWAALGLFSVCCATVFQISMWWDGQPWLPCACLVLGSIIGAVVAVLLSVTLQLWYWYQLSTGGGLCNLEQIAGMYLLPPTRPCRVHCMRLLHITLDGFEPHLEERQDATGIVTIAGELWLADVANRALAYDISAIIGRREIAGLRFTMVTNPITAE